MIKTCVIFAGGRGTRLMPVTDTIPKPLVEIGGKPIMWHIMRYLHHLGVTRFIIATGYKHEKVVEYWANYGICHAPEIDISPQGPKTGLQNGLENWEISIKNTGIVDGTASRLRQLRDRISDDRFLVAYGDNLADIDLAKLEMAYEKERTEGSVGVITTYQPNSRFGVVEFEGTRVKRFIEKPKLSQYINIGFMVFSMEIFDFIKNADTEDMLEFTTLPELTKQGRLGQHTHTGFWEPMDSYRDYVHLNELWETGKAPWKKWK